LTYKPAWKFKDIKYSDIDYLGKYKFVQIKENKKINKKIKGIYFRPYQRHTYIKATLHKQESRQRAIIFKIIDTNMNGSLTFGELFRFIG